MSAADHGLVLSQADGDVRTDHVPGHRRLVPPSSRASRAPATEYGNVKPLIGMRREPAGPAVTRANDQASRPGQPAYRRQSWHRRRSGPATSGVCARGAAGPAASPCRSPGRRAASPPVPGGQGTSRWLMPGGQRGLPAAAPARARGGRIKVIVAWQPARRLGRLCRRHQPPPGDAGQVPRCPGLAPCRIRRRCAPRVPVDACDRVRAGCGTWPGT
jgi:hypothetical protein